MPHTAITKAELITNGTFAPPAGKPLTHLPAFCHVTAMLKPSPDSDIRVEIWMPESGWNLNADARSVLSQAAVNACDALDGVKDGVIADRTKCLFDPVALECKGTTQEGCLTAAQVQTAKEIYAGPVNPRTGQSLCPGLPRGSEFGWDGLDRVPGANATPPYAPIFQWVFGPDWNWRQFDFDHQDTAFTRRLAGMVNATRPDIDTFRAHGLSCSFITGGQTGSIRDRAAQTTLLISFAL